jgi:hypothetical protein
VRAQPLSNCGFRDPAKAELFPHWQLSSLKSGGFTFNEATTNPNNY